MSLTATTGKDRSMASRAVTVAGSVADIILWEVVLVPAVIDNVRTQYND